MDLLRDDACLGGAQELDDMVDLRARGHLLLNLQDGVLEGTIAIEHQAVGVGDVLHLLLVDSLLAPHGEVDATIEALAGNDDIGGNILGEGGAGLYHRTHAHARLGILNDAGGEDDVVFDEAVAGNLRAIAEDAAVAHLGVVGDVGALHQHVAIADDGLAAMMGGAVDDDILTDDVAVADDTL